MLNGCQPKPKVIPMQTDLIPASPGTLIIAIEYDETGLASCRLTDYQCLGWHAEPAAYPFRLPQPSIVDRLPDPAPDTSPVISPTWAKFVGGPAIMVPDNT
jgi:hypothetical protein